MSDSRFDSLALQNREGAHAPPRKKNALRPRKRGASTIRRVPFRNGNVSAELDGYRIFWRRKMNRTIGISIGGLILLLVIVAIIF